jgi:hypothetical protein
MNTYVVEFLPIFLHNRKISSDYQLLGNDENALTYALGHCLSHDRIFLAAFLRRCKFKGVKSTNVGRAEIHLQEQQEEKGIVDLEIFIEGKLQLIVEAKKGGGYPGFDQIKKYMKRLITRQVESRVVVLTEVIDDIIRKSLMQQFGKHIEFLTWSDVLYLSQSLIEGNNATFTIHSFSAFMKEVYAMNLNVEEEVWIVPLSTKWKTKKEHMSAAEVHVKYGFWVMGNWKTRRSLYMAFRYDGRLQYIGRIKGIESGLKSSEICPMDVRDFWRPEYEPYDVVRLDKVIPFPIKLSSGNIYNKHIYCDFDLLLTSKSILEAESRMRKRREQRRLF